MAGLSDYLVRFDVPQAVWLNSVSLPDERTRARKRAAIRRLCKSVWRAAKSERPESIGRLNRYLMCLSLSDAGGEPAAYGAEACKPLIDAGTDARMWPDDDSEHRLMTVYMAGDDKPREGHSVGCLCLPVKDGWRPAQAVDALVAESWRRYAQAGGAIPDAGIRRMGVRVPLAVWTTSNQTDSDMAARLHGRRAANPSEWGKGRHDGGIDHALGAFISRLSPTVPALWNGRPLGWDTYVCVAAIAYKAERSGSRRMADPDNAAETVVAALDLMAAQGYLPGADNAHLKALCYCRASLAEERTVRAGEHEVFLTFYPVPPGFDPTRLMPLAAYL